MHQNNRRSVVAGFLEERTRLAEVRGKQSCHAFVRRERSPANEYRVADLIVVRIPDFCPQEVFLIESEPQRLAHFWIVERLRQMVRAKDELATIGIPGPQFDVRIALQERQQIVRRLLYVIDLSG